jgi:DEAD/DEAH box helicase domain-containing protein
MIIYDLEIQNLIPPKNGDRLPDLKYCQGWTDYAGMGLACLALYDCARNEYHVFDEFQIDDLKQRFAKTDTVVGFNILKFDNNVLATYDIKIEPGKCYDLLLEIARAAGTPNDYSGLSLGAICKANFNTTKSGNGADAPKLYQFGNYGELFNYCLADVRLTKQVYDRIHETGHIINPRTGKWIRVNRPK